MESQDLSMLLAAAAVLAGRQFFVTVAKTIPDSAEGLPGIIRMVCKVLGVYVTNKK